MIKTEMYGDTRKLARIFHSYWDGTLPIDPEQITKQRVSGLNSFVKAHKIYHRISDTDCKEDYRIDTLDFHEKQANEFALHLLIPSASLKKTIRELDDLSYLKKLSEKYGVTTVAIKHKLMLDNWIRT